MPDLPAHPGTEEPAPPPGGSQPGTRRLRAIAIAVIVIAVLTVILLHVTGVVGAGTNG
jgi:hypothetical protein